MSTESYMTGVIALMVNAVLFGIGIATVLSIPALSAKAVTLIPVVVFASILLSGPLSAYLAPRLRLRWHRRTAHADLRRRMLSDR